MAQRIASVSLALIAICILWSVVHLPSARAVDGASSPAPAGVAANPQETLKLEMTKDLRKRQEELDRKETEIKSREEQLRVLEQGIEKKIEELKRTQLRLEELVKMRDDLEARNVVNLSKAFSAMPPADAAERLKTMDRAIALRILMAMKTKNSSKILSSLDSATASQISEQLAKRQME